MSLADGSAGRVLVVRLGALGDVVNALVFATALRESFPGIEIGWVTHELARPLVVGNPAVDRCHLWPRRSGASGFRAIAAELRASRYDLAVDLQRILKSAALTRSAGASRSIGYHRSQVKEASWLLLPAHLPPHPKRAHMVERYLHAARALGAHAEQPIHSLPVDPEAEAWADHLIDELGGAPLVVHVGASKPENRWPAERFGEVAARAKSELDRPVCFVGAPGDRAAADAALAVAPEAHDAVGATDVPRLVSLLRRAPLFLGCDSGPMHLAAACGASVVAIFGPAQAWRTGPWGEPHRVLRVPPYDPRQRDAPDPDPPARTEDVDVDRVLATLAEVALQPSEARR